MTNEAKDDLRQFIRILYETLKIFYSLDKLNFMDYYNENKKDKSKKKNGSKTNLFTRDNMINFFTSIIFRKSNLNINSKEMKVRNEISLNKNDMKLPETEIIDIYSVVIKLLTIEDLGKGDQFKKALDLVINYEPEDFGIDPRFCLNMRTIEYLENKHKKYFTLPLKNGNVKQIKSGITACPYGKAIEILETINEQRSPLHKLKVISKTAQTIYLCIKEFYENMGITDIDKLDGDNTLSVFMYLTSKSKIKDIQAQCNLSLNFTTENILHSMTGYYLATLEACVEFIINLSMTNKPKNVF